MNARQDQNLFRPRGRKGLGKTAFFLFLILAAGSGIPHLLSKKLPGPPAGRSDAIVVLTGDENRIPEGFRAWKEGKGAELYILGAGRGTKLESILPGRHDLTPAELRRIHIEGWSENTLENAYSAKSLVEDHGFRNVILVTSDYHIPRAHLALRTVLPPAVSIGVIPVRSEWKGQAVFLRTLRHFFDEGWKYWGYRIFLLWE